MEKTIEYVAKQRASINQTISYIEGFRIGLFDNKNKMHPYKQAELDFYTSTKSSLDGFDGQFEALFKLLQRRVVEARRRFANLTIKHAKEADEKKKSRDAKYKANKRKLGRLREQISSVVRIICPIPRVLSKAKPLLREEVDEEQLQLLKHNKHLTGLKSLIELCSGECAPRPLINTLTEKGKKKYVVDK